MQNFWKNIPKPILALAPMAGITDLPFRLICKRFNADVVYTEMVSIDGIKYKSKNTLQLLELKDEERPVICQLFGADPEFFYNAAKFVESFGFDGVDINFGCPVRKVFKAGAGCALMQDLKLSREVVQAVCAAVKIPVSLKIRAGIGEITALDFIENIKDLPIKAIMIHGRTYKGGFSGKIDFEMIKKSRDILHSANCIILANGGINTPKDAKEMLNKTGADGIGLARGVLGRPWLFSECKKRVIEKKDFEDIKKIVLDHAELAYKLKGKWGIREMRKHLAWYVKGFSGAAKLRKKLVRVESLEEIKKIFKKI